jgi:nitrogen fixation protein NifU and related proteins
MDLYAENILQHYKNPQGKRPLASETVKHEEINHSCGDALTISLSLHDGKVSDLGWDGTGCAISQAAMSMLSEELRGKTTEEIEAMTPKHIYDLLSVPIGPRRFKCALLCLHTLKNALRKARNQEPQSWLETVQVD